MNKNKMIIALLSMLLFIQTVWAKPDWQKISKSRDGSDTYYVDTKLTDQNSMDSRKKFHMLLDMDFVFGGMVGIFEGKIRIRSWEMSGEVDCTAGSFSLFSSAMYGGRFATGDLFKNDQFEPGQYTTTELDGDEHMRVIYDFLCTQSAKK